jgi:YidC/Oxa1 family membrane protein insertase
MDRQTSIAFVLIGVVLVVWLYMNSPTPPPKDQQNPAPATVEKKDTNEIKTPVQEAKPAAENEVPFATKPAQSEKIVTIETDLVKMELTSKGGRLKRYFLKNYKTWYHNEIGDTNYYRQQVQLVSAKNGGDFNIIFVTKDGKLVNTAAMDFDPSISNHYYRVTGDDSLSLSYVFTADDGKSIKKNFKFFGNNYASKIDLEFENFQDVISSFRYDVVWANGLNFVEKNAADEATNANASAYAAEEQVIVDASGNGEKVTKDINGKVDWIAVRNKYFAAIIAPEAPGSDGGAYFEGHHFQNKYGDREVYSASLKVPFNNQSYQKDSFYSLSRPYSV